MPYGRQQITPAERVREARVGEVHFRILAAPHFVQRFALPLIRERQERAILQDRFPPIAHLYKGLGRAQRDAEPLVLGRASGSVEHDLVLESSVRVERPHDNTVVRQRKLDRAAAILRLDDELARGHCSRKLGVSVAGEESDGGALLKVLRLVRVEAHGGVSVGVGLDQRVVEPSRQRGVCLNLLCQARVHGLEYVRCSCILGCRAHDGRTADVVRPDKHCSQPALAHIFEPNRRQQFVEEVGSRSQRKGGELVEVVLQQRLGVIPLVHAEEGRPVLDDTRAEVLIGVQLAQLLHALGRGWLQALELAIRHFEQGLPLSENSLRVRAANDVPHAGGQHPGIEDRRPDLVRVEPVG
mmetsp:Transcript_38462/g.78824  ORF Transcript_38462/g.78824 Transcript_38462/m.78824 type:complete len:355 (+) Transcript_38462:74-1138(+)